MSTPMLVRALRGSWSRAPFRMSIPSGRPPLAVMSPLTPAVVAAPESRCSIAVNFSVAGICSFESTG